MRVGDVARLPLVESDENAAFLHDVADGKPRTVAVAPRGTGNGWKHHVGPYAPDALERVFQCALLGRHLQRIGRMLQRAPAAYAEVRATRNNAVGTRPVDAHHTRHVVARLALHDFGGDALARERAFDEHDLAVRMSDAAAFLVE